MRRTASLAIVAVTFALFAVAGPSRSASEEASPLAHGIVKGIDAKAKTVTLDHEDIPGVMMAMTMAYGVSDPALLSKVEVGQAVDFRLRKDGDGNYVVTEIKPAEMHHRMSGADAHNGMKP